MKSHRDLTVYKTSVDLVLDIYRVTHSFPDEEKFGLVSQLRRAAVSIPSIIGEEAARKSKKDFCRFLYMALGSLAEREAQLEISSRLNFKTDYRELEEKGIYIRRMLLKLIKSIKTNDAV